MSSRFGNYLDGAKLAKLHLGAARSLIEKLNGDDKRGSALRHLIHAVEELITANNNLASIAFKKKPKKKRAKRKPKYTTPESLGAKAHKIVAKHFQELLVEGDQKHENA